MRFLVRTTVCIGACLSIAANCLAQCPSEWRSGITGSIANVARIVSYNSSDVIVIGNAGDGYIGSPADSNRRTVARYTISSTTPYTAGTWSAFGHGIGTASEHGGSCGVALSDNGDIIVGGDFDTANYQNESLPGIPVNNIARWSVSQQTWTDMDGGLPNTPFHSEVNDMVVAPNGDVYVAGYIATAGQLAVKNIARYVPSENEWYQLGTSSDLFRGAAQINGQPPNEQEVRATIYGLAIMNGKIVLAGEFNRVGNNIACMNIAMYDPSNSTWSALSTSVDGRIRDITSTPDGDIIAVGSFSTIATGVSANKVAKLDHTSLTWSALGSGIVTGSSVVSSVTALADGSLVVGGRFAATDSDSQTANNIIRWNGSGWYSMGDGIQDSGVPDVYALTVHSTGDLFVGGHFNEAGGYTALNFSRWGLPESTGTCDSIDFNNDSSFFDTQDIEAFLSVYGEGPCVPETATCNDIDFNNDCSIFDPCDYDSFELMFSEGPCTPCGV